MNVLKTLIANSAKESERMDSDRVSATAAGSGSRSGDDQDPENAKHLVGSSKRTQATRIAIAENPHTGSVSSLESNKINYSRSHFIAITSSTMLLEVSWLARAAGSFKNYVSCRCSRH